MAKGKYEYWLTEEGLLKLQSWARCGLTDEQIAHNMGISRSTLNEWKNKYPDISDTLKKEKEIVDIQVENALLKRALGYDVVEETEELIDGRLVVTKRVKKHISADTTAQIFWLKNRKPKEWPDKRDLSVEGNIKTNNPFEGLSTDELRKLIDSE